MLNRRYFFYLLWNLICFCMMIDLGYGADSASPEFHDPSRTSFFPADVARRQFCSALEQNKIDLALSYIRSYPDLDVNLSTSHGITLLHIVAVHNFISDDDIDLLMERGASFFAYTSETFKTPMHYAVKGSQNHFINYACQKIKETRGDTELNEVLIRQDRFMQTPLDLAIKENNHVAASILRRFGAVSFMDDVSSEAESERDCLPLSCMPFVRNRTTFHEDWFVDSSSERSSDEESFVQLPSLIVPSDFPISAVSV